MLKVLSVERQESLDNLATNEEVHYEKDTVYVQDYKEDVNSNAGRHDDVHINQSQSSNAQCRRNA